MLFARQSWTIIESHVFGRDRVFCVKGIDCGDVLSMTMILALHT